MTRAVLVTSAEERAHPGEDQDRRERHRQRVRRIAEEQREALDQRDLEEHEAQPEGREVEGGPALARELRPRAANRDERQQEEDGGEEGGDPEQQQQHPLTRRVLDVVGPAGATEVPDHLAEPVEVPEERPVVGDGPHVVGVRVVPAVQLGLRERGDRGHRVGLRRLAGRVPHGRVRHHGLLGDEPRDLVGREGRALHEDGRQRAALGAPRRADEDVLRRVVDSEVRERWRAVLT